MIDLLLDTLMDLKTDNGDVVTGDSTRQNQSLLLVLDKGSLVQFPTSCVGAGTFLESEDTAGLLREAAREFVQDGMTVNALRFDDDGKLHVDARY